MIVEVCEVWDYLKLMAAEVMIETCLLHIGCFLTLVASSKLLLTKTTFPIYILQINNSNNSFKATANIILFLFKILDLQNN